MAVSSRIPPAPCACACPSGKGIGELGATGVDAAVADAVCHATGRRIRELPITPDKLLPAS
jgi:CO/xanthine dehydrogenase Mo-binding subunit